MRPHTLLPFILSAAMAAGPASAQPTAPVPVIRTAPAAPVCADCGTITRIREISQPVPPQRNAFPQTAPGTTAGGLGSDNRTTTLFSLDREGFHRPARPPVTRSQWEVTVRFDNGAYGLVVEPSEPANRVGDRVQVVDDRLEPLPVPPGESRAPGP